MTLFTPKKVVLNWLDYNVNFELELIESFIEGVEKQAQDSYEKYKEQKETHFFPENPGEEGFARVVESHQGLDNEMWDLESIFREYFPSLQRRSALLTLFGYFEHELNKLCFLYQSQKSFKLSLSDLSGKGLDRSANYLEKVAQINAFKTSKEWNEIKNIQKIRNIIVHQTGKLYDAQDNPIKDAIKYLEKSEWLEESDKEVLIKEGFLAHCLKTFSDYFIMLDKSIKSNETA